LLSADGAAYALDGGAWGAAYDYYGHDATGVTYADQVLARAIGWSQHGFCMNCGIDTRLVEAVHAAYGAPVQAALVKASAARVRLEAVSIPPVGGFGACRANLLGDITPSRRCPGGEVDLAGTRRAVAGGFTVAPGARSRSARGPSARQ
jgi:hypothetical protein